MIKAVFFDLDGTLVDTLPDLAAAMNEMLAKFGYKERTTSEILSAICYGQREFVRRSMPDELSDDDQKIEECQKCYADCYAARIVVDTTVYEGIRETVRSLNSHGIKCAVITNKAGRNALAVIGRLFDEDDFVCVKGHDGSMPTKPDPALTLKTAGDLGLSPSECVFVGDSDVDIATGKNAGMRTAGVTWGYRDEDLLVSSGADFIAHTPAQLLEYLLSL